MFGFGILQFFITWLAVVLLAFAFGLPPAELCTRPTLIFGAVASASLLLPGWSLAYHSHDRRWRALAREWVRVFVRFQTESASELAALIVSGCVTLGIIGGSVVLPLDAGTVLQVWPVAPFFGAIRGFAVGVCLAAICIATSHCFPARPKHPKDATAVLLGSISSSR